MLMPESCPKNKAVVETNRHKAGIELRSCLVTEQQEKVQVREWDEESTKVCYLRVPPACLDPWCEKGCISHACTGSLLRGTGILVELTPDVWGDEFQGSELYLPYLGK